MRAADGQLLWSGLTNGAAKRFGRSYKAENYYEAISDSFIDAVQRLVEHSGFVVALSAPAGVGPERGKREP